MISPSEALRRFEQKLIPVRTVAGNEHSWEQYLRETLPESLDTTHQVAIHQGFSAGYDAAMAQVRRILGEVQSETLRAPTMDVVADGTVGMRRG